MALLHYFYTHGEGITLCVLNCDHGMRGEHSAADSRFVADFCRQRHIPLRFFRSETRLKGEESARDWRRQCYLIGAQGAVLSDGARWHGYDLLATAHHLDDNAETVLFRLARGTGLNGMVGIADERIEKVTAFSLPSGERAVPEERRERVVFIRPMLACTREEIDGYLEENGVPFVTDESNEGDDYTRNKIRHTVLPALEAAVPGAAKAVYRFSRLAAEDEEYLSRKAEELLIKIPNGYKIRFCQEKVLFKRAVITGLERAGKKDYTHRHLDELFALRDAENGKRYEFLLMTAIKEGDGISLCAAENLSEPLERPLADFLGGAEEYGGELFRLQRADGEEADGEKRLRFDLSTLPEGAIVRFMRAGDTFCRFGGKRKNLGDYFTDIKLPVRLRKKIPLIAKGREVYIVGGVEIAESVKVKKESENGNVVRLFCTDYRKN